VSAKLNKIDKLLRLNENNPEGAEAASALRKAGKLMRDYIDNGESPDGPTDNKRIAELEKREREVEKICRGCGQEKPNHHEKCLTYEMTKRANRAGTIGCFSCAGIMFIWFISALINLVMKLFG